MNRYFTKTFFKFLTGFLVIIAVAFGILMLTASQIGSPRGVDNIALPR